MKWSLNDKIKKAIKENVLSLIPDNFDWKYYLEQNRDLVASGIENEETAIEHFVIFGKNENRLFSRPNLIKKENKKEDISYLKDLSDINKKILIKIPTLRRPQQLIESIDSFLNNAHNKECKKYL